MEADLSVKFSPSKLSTYQECPKRYQFRYIDKVPGGPASIEAFLGTCVHAALEELYRGLMHAKILTLGETLAEFERAWEEGGADKAVIRDAKYSLADWKTLGRRCVENYYRANEPFDSDQTIDVERRIGFPLAAAGEEFRIEGFIDRLAAAPDGAFEIHDYKTSGTLPTQEDKDADWQLAIYEIAVREAWPDAKEVRLVWHFVRFGQKIVSTRSPEALAALRAEIARLIERIKSDHEFAPKKSALCDWCDYRALCPLFKHPARVAALAPAARRRDDGVRLVDQYAALEEKKHGLKDEIRRIEAEEAGLEAELAGFAEALAATVVAGSDGEVSVTEKDEYKFPTKTHAPEALEALERELKATPLWPEVSRLDSHALMDGYKRKAWPEELLSKVEGVLGRYVKRVREKVVRFRRRKTARED